MKKGYIINNGKIKLSWMWATDDNCPFPACLELEEGDEAVIIDDLISDEEYEKIHTNLEGAHEKLEKARKEDSRNIER